MYWTCIKEVGLSESNNKSSHDSSDTRSFPIDYLVQKKILSKQIFDPDYGLRGRSHTTLTRFCLFYWPHAPLRWHVLPYNGWQKVKILELMSESQKRIPSTVVYYNYAWYPFLRLKRYNFEPTFIHCLCFEERES